MTRFWLTLEQGVQFVINCMHEMEGGETFIPKIPSMSLLELAKAIAPDAKIKNIGIRPGEKLHEILLTEDESRHTTEYEKYFVIEPEYVSWQKKSLPGGKKPADDFSYTSDTNSSWLTRDDLIRLVGL
jgi:UDP-N-acetylglucosamine 4,6-dehydratase